MVTEEQRVASLEKLKRDTSNLPTRRELAWQELKNGVAPSWLSAKYGFPVEVMEQAKWEMEARLSKQRAPSADTPDRQAGS